MTLAPLLAGLAAAFGAVALALALPPLPAPAADRPRPVALLITLGERLRLSLGGGARRGAQRLESLLAAAGGPASLGPRDLLALKLGSAAAGLALAPLVAGGAPGRLAYLVAVAMPVAGFLAPDLWLRRRARLRAEQMARDLPDLLDLLRVSVRAGLSLDRALEAVSARLGGPLAAECRRTALEVALGTRRELALEALARRAPLPEVRAFVAAIQRAERHGAPLADALAAQARDARSRRRRRAQESAARAGPKIQLIVALVLVPSVLLLMAALLAANLLGSGRGLLLGG